MAPHVKLWLGHCVVFLDKTLYLREPLSTQEYYNWQIFRGICLDAGVNLVIDKQLINTPCHFISVYNLGFCGKQILETKFPSPISCK